MSAPTAPIDADLSEQDGISYHVLEIGSSWLTQNLGGGLATWAEVLNASAFTDGTGLKFQRVKCSVQTAGLLFLLGYAQKPDLTFAQYCFRSANNGSTWTWAEVAEIPDPTDDFDVDLETWTGNHGAVETIQKGNPAELICTAAFNGGGAFQYVSGIGSVHLPVELPDRNDIAVEYDVVGTFASIDYDTDGDQVPKLFDATLTITPISGGFHVETTSFRADLQADRSRLPVGYHPSDPARWASGASATRVATFKNWVIDGVSYGGQAAGFDISRNTGALYVGCEDQIYKSLDSGFTWTAMPTAEGATDILVDPLLGGVIYYWCTDGILKQAVADATPKNILTATRQSNPSTIARDWLSGKVFAIDASGNLKSSTDFVTWTTLKSGLIGARGLKAYYASPTKLVFVDQNNIYLSLDAGVNWSNKKGVWAINSPRTVHLLP